MLPILQRADKKKRPVMTTLLQIRNIVADFAPGRRQDDYKTYKKGQPVALTARCVSASATQLHIMRTMVRAVYDDKSSARASAGFFNKKDLDNSEAATMEAFYKSSLYFPYLLGFNFTVSEISDLGDLWYREFYLEVTRQIQFPVAMSLPWILTEHVINNVSSDSPLIEDLLYTMDIYNDAAQRALYHFNNQYLYDEIQAEVNLAFDQLVFAISDETYSYHKDLAASTCLPMEYKTKLEAVKKEHYLTKRIRRHDISVGQRHVQLLGRSVDLNLLISQNTSNKLYADIEGVVKRYESSELSYILEFKSTMEVLRKSHELLKKSGVALDDFDSMVDVVNESIGATSVSGRIAIHTLRSLVTDLFPNYSYNIYTQRYVRSTVEFRKNERSGGGRAATGNMGYGTMCRSAFENINRAGRGFVGSSHLMAVIDCLGKAALPLLVEECLNNLEERLVDVGAYLTAMKEGLPPCKLPKYMFRTGGCYGFFEGKLKPFLSYEDLKPEVFQNFREVGNTLFFLRDLSDLIDLIDSYGFVGASSFVGISCASGKGESSAGRGSSNSVYSVGGGGGALIKLATGEMAGNLWGEMLDDSNDLYTKETTGVRSTFKTALAHVKKTMEQIGIMNDWSSRPTTSGGLDVENPNDFYRLFSALNFLFCLHEEDGSAADDEDDEYLTDEEEFGHGFALAGLLMIHNLRQRNTFELLDFSYHVLNVQKHEACSVPDSKGMIGQVDDAMQRQTDLFVVQANRQRDVHFKIFSLLEANDPVSGGEVSVVTFHPPPLDTDLKSIPAGALKISSQMKILEQRAHSLSLEDTGGKPPPPPKPMGGGKPAPPARPTPLGGGGKPAPPPKPNAPVPPARAAPPMPPKPAAAPAPASAPPVPPARAAPPMPPKPMSDGSVGKSVPLAAPSKPAPPPKPAAAPASAPPAPPKPAAAAAPASAPPIPPARAAPPVPSKPMSYGSLGKSLPLGGGGGRPAPPPKPAAAAEAPPVKPAPPPKPASAPASAPPVPPKPASGAGRPPPPPKPSLTSVASNSSDGGAESPTKAAPPPPPPKKNVGLNLSGTSVLPVGIGRAPPPPPPKR